MSLPCQADAFQLPPNLHYLNCSYMSPQAKRVEAAGAEALLGKRDPTTIAPADFFTQSDRLRELFARLIHAPDRRSIAIVPSVSYAMSIASRNLLREGDAEGGNVVIAEAQFPSAVLAWSRRASETGATLRTIPRPGSDRPGAAWNESLLAAIDSDTLVVCLPNVHWTDGTLMDLEAIGARAREVGAALVVDGTQSIGALPFDVTKIGADLVVSAGYKWLLGPYSIGLAYLGPRFNDGEPLEENWIGRAGSDDFSGLTEYSERYLPAAGRYDVGERSNFLLVPMLIAALELVLEWGPDAIQEYCGELQKFCFDRLSDSGYGVPDSEDVARHLWGIRVPDAVAADRLQAALKRERVSVSMRGGAIRVSPHLYNREADIEALVRALEEARR